MLVGRPEVKDFICHIEARSLTNCPITQQDAINAHAIFGRDIGSIKGKRDGDDSDYDPSTDDNASYASSKDSDYNPNTDGGSTDDGSSDGSTDHDFQQNPDLTALQPAEIPGVNDNDDDTLGLDDVTPGVDEEPDIDNDTPGVYKALENNADTLGVDETPEINKDNELIEANEYNEPTEAKEEN